MTILLFVFKYVNQALLWKITPSSPDGERRLDGVVQEPLAVTRFQAHEQLTLEDDAYADQPMLQPVTHKKVCSCYPSAVWQQI